MWQKSSNISLKQLFKKCQSHLQKAFSFKNLTFSTPKPCPSAQPQPTTGLVNRLRKSKSSYCKSLFICSNKPVLRLYFTLLSHHHSQDSVLQMKLRKEENQHFFFLAGSRWILLRFPWCTHKCKIEVIFWNLLIAVFIYLLNSLYLFQTSFQLQPPPQTCIQIHPSTSLPPTLYNIFI